MQPIFEDKYLSSILEEWNFDLLCNPQPISSGFSYIFFAETNTPTLKKKVVIKNRKNRNFQEKLDFFWKAEKKMKIYEWPNKVDLIGSFRIKTDSGMLEYIMMEMCDFSLRLLLKHNNQLDLNISTIDEIWWIIAQIVVVLLKSNNENIYHRDLKPENLLLKLIPSFNEASSKSYSIYHYQLKIGDWGLCKFKNYYSSDASLNSNVVCGTDKYRAPEIKPKSNYGSQVDIYSLGIIALELYSYINRIKNWNNTISNTLNNLVEMTLMSEKNFDSPSSSLNFSSTKKSNQPFYNYKIPFFSQKNLASSLSNFSKSNFSSFQSSAPSSVPSSVQRTSMFRTSNGKMVEFFLNTITRVENRFSLSQVANFSPIKYYTTILEKYLNPILQITKWTSAVITLLENTCNKVHIYHLAVFAAVNCIKVYDQICCEDLQDPFKYILSHTKSSLLCKIQNLLNIAKLHIPFMNLKSALFEYYNCNTKIPCFHIILFYEAVQLKERAFACGPSQLLLLDVSATCMQYTVNLIDKLILKFPQSNLQIDKDTVLKHIEIIADYYPELLVN